jgi:hypothetical protein
MVKQPSMFHNKVEARGARAIAKIGVRWERGYKARTEITFIVSTALFSTFLPMAFTQAGGEDMTGLWIVLAILSFWIMFACIWLDMRYSNRKRDKRIAKIERKLDNLDDTNNLLKELIDRLNKDGKL